MPTSLVTGAAGFIGSHVAKHLLAAGHHVVALDDLSGGSYDNVPSGSAFAHGTITDAEFVRRVFDDTHPDYVFHCAAYAAEGLSHFIRRFNYTNNLLGSVTLINEAVRHDVRRFVFTSSMAVYGSGQVPMTEELTPQPEDPYGIAKYAVELDLAAAHELFGLDYTIFRPHNVYGPGQNIGDRYRNVIGIFMNQLMRGEPLTVFGDGTQTRAFSYIDNVAPIIAQCVQVPASANTVLNIGADKPYSVLELAHAVARALGAKANIEYLPPRHEVMHAYTDHTRLREVFGNQRLTPLDVGLYRMADWAMRRGPQQASQFDGIEISYKLPPSWDTTSV